MKVNEVYNGWKVLDISSIPEYKSEGIWLKNEKYGMEVFHMLNDDEENLFSFAFKTIPEDSKGAAHILEHSVLCGSERYPLKDPFLQLSNQSIKTFLNALTFPDKTVYPASSMVEQDYFNLMSVYGDAVFYPKLDKMIFSQEAHHYEYDENGNLSIQGVVYNEMKGSYSSFESVASDYLIQTLLPGTTYQYDSGGNPEFIPDITYEELVEFHHKYYSPNNCKLFLYGNISTEKQLDFINDNFLVRWTNNNKIIESPLIELEYFTQPKRIEKKGPISDNSKSEQEKNATVTLNWVTGESNDPKQFMELVLLDEILMGHDGSPLTRALLESNLGEDIAPSCGAETELKYLLFSTGLRGVKKENVLKVEELILSVLSNLKQNGISKDDVDAAVMAVDFSDREVKRFHGPYSLILMRRSLRGWLNGVPPVNTLKNRQAFSEIKESILKQPKYLENLIDSLFLQNNHRTLLSVFPDKSYNDKIEMKLKKRLQIADCSKLKEETLDLQKKLNLFQQTPESDNVRLLIPHLKPSELKEKINIIETEIKTINKVPIFVHNDAVNGIAYMEYGIPVDILDPEDYFYLPFFAATLTNVGFGNMNWGESAARIAAVTGGLNARLFTSSVIPNEELSSKSWYNRDWLFINIKMLNEKTEEAVSLLFNCLNTVDFTDKKRIDALLLEYKNDLVASVIPSGNEYVVSRASCKNTHSKAVNEIWNGLSQLFKIQNICGEKLTENTIDFICSKLISIQKKLSKAGAIVSITAETEEISILTNLLNKYLISIEPPQVKQQINDDVFFMLTELPTVEQKEEKAFIADKEFYRVNTQIGFASSVFKKCKYQLPQSIYMDLLGHWMSNNILWERIRTVGGAYGAFAYYDTLESSFLMATFRDPKPLASIDEFRASIEYSVNHILSKIDMERLITGCYSREIQPSSPSGRGFTGFVRKLYGITDELREKKMHLLLNATPEDVQNAAKYLLKQYFTVKSVVISDKFKNITGKIIDLPL